MNSIVFDPSAKDEFLDAIRFYNDCQNNLGNRFRLAIESATQKISETPFMYRVLKAPFRRYLTSTLHKNFIIKDEIS